MSTACKKNCICFKVVVQDVLTFLVFSKWVRIHVKKGDLMTLPEGIYHRFTTDETDMIHAMRLFVGQPVWTPFNRPCDDHPSRKKFVESYLKDSVSDEKKDE